MVGGLGVGDVNGDGMRDLLVLAPTASDTASAVSILLNTTPPGAVTPSFSTPIMFDGGTAIEITLADVDGDNRLDVILGDAAGGSVLRNTTASGASTPTFGPPTAFPGLNIVRRIIPADIDGDGATDLVFNGPNDPIGTNFVSVDRNTTTGSTVSFAGPTSFDAVVSGLASFDVGDVTHDGKPDIVINNNGSADGSTGFHVLTNTTAGPGSPPTFSSASFAAGLGPVGIAAVDVNVDGYPDVVTGDARSVLGSVTSFRISTGSSVEPFGPITSFAGIPAQPSEIVSGDFNDDGKADILAGLPAFVQGYELYMNLTPPGATAPTMASAMSVDFANRALPTAPVRVADVTGDGKPDIVRLVYSLNPDGTLTLSPDWA